MKPNFSKIRVVSFTRKTRVLNCECRLGISVTLRTGCIKHLGVYRILIVNFIFINIFMVSFHMH
jgi:hypothetical protein